MKIAMLKNILVSVFMIYFLAFSSSGLAEDNKKAASTTAADQTVESTVQDETEDTVADKRKTIVAEAVEALAQTRAALQALEDKKVKEALDALAVVIGKLELIVARDPEMSLAPTDVSVVTYDLYASTDTIKYAIKQAKEAIGDGQIQKARLLLEDLASEIVITVTNLPLATYPDAIKAVTPLIDDGKYEEAKLAIQAALNTVVLTKHVIPLQILRAKEFLARAEHLSEKKDRTDDENKELSNNLTSARTQLEMAELLGYGDKNDYRKLYRQLDQIKLKTTDGKSGSGFFNKIKHSLSELWK